MIVTTTTNSPSRAQQFVIWGEMTVLHHLRDFLKKHKRNILALLLAAGCYATAMALTKSRKPLMQFAIFEKLANNATITAAVTHGQELEFRTLMPQWFRTDISNVDQEYLCDLLKDCCQLISRPFTLFDRYQDVIYGVSGAACITASFIFREASNNNTRPLPQPAKIKQVLQQQQMVKPQHPISRFQLKSMEAVIKQGHLIKVMSKWKEELMAKLISTMSEDILHLFPDNNYFQQRNKNPSSRIIIIDNSESICLRDRADFVRDIITSIPIKSYSQIPRKTSPTAMTKSDTSLNKPEWGKGGEGEGLGKSTPKLSRRERIMMKLPSLLEKFQIKRYFYFC